MPQAGVPERGHHARFVRSIGMAYYLGADPIAGALLFAVASALGIEATSSGKRIREDSAIGLIWSLGMALGIIFIYLTPGYAPNLMSFLFGNILSVTSADLLWMGAVDAAIVAGFALFYRPILYVAFDRDYSRSQNMPTRLVSYAMAALVAVTIVMSIRVAGHRAADLAADHTGRRREPADPVFRPHAPRSSLIAVLGSFAGLYIGYRNDVPSGAVTIFVLTLTLMS